MTRWIRAALLGIGALVMAPAAANAATIFIDFENVLYSEGSTPGEQGVTFTNAVVYTSGAIGGSLNESDFPPHSDFNVAFDDPTGPMVLEFSTPIVSFSAFFTYNAQLTLTALDGGSTVDTETSSTSANFTSAPGTPNEQLTLSFAGGFNRVEILGSVSGFSFAIDDITAETRGVVVAPEPASMWLLGLGAAALIRRRAKH